MGGGFSKAIGQFSSKAMKNVAVVHRKTCLELSARIINDTPVLMGILRGNWMPGVNQWAPYALQPADKDGGKTIQRVIACLAELGPKDTFTLVNRMPYAVAIEKGHSQKAPEGMVERNVKAFPGLVVKISKEVRQ